MAREVRRYHALADACRSLRMRVENAKMRSTACVADSQAVMERVRRGPAAGRGKYRDAKERTEFVTDVTKAFSERPRAQHIDLSELQRHLERIRAHSGAIAALYGRFHSAKRNC